MIETLLLMDREPGCTCAGVYLNDLRRQEYALLWKPECPVHGTESEWYEKEGRAQIETTKAKSVESQRQAREAKARVRRQG